MILAVTAQWWSWNELFCDLRFYWSMWCWQWRCFPGWLWVYIWWYFPLYWLLTDSHSWFQAVCVVVYDLWWSWKLCWVCFWASWTWCWNINECIFFTVGKTACWHWGVLVTHDRMFIIWMWGVIYDRMSIISLGYEMVKFFGAGDQFSNWDCSSEWIVNKCSNSAPDPTSSNS